MSARKKKPPRVLYVARDEDHPNGIVVGLTEISLWQGYKIYRYERVDAKKAGRK